MALAWLRGDPLPRRLGALGAMIGLYLAFDWVLLRSALSNVTASILSGLGHNASASISGAQVYLTADGARFSIQPSCTYIDLVLILIPFAWRMGRSIGANLLQITTLALALLALNLVRVVAAIHFDAGGAGWNLVHDTPDQVFYFTALFTALLLSARSDLRLAGYGAAIPGRGTLMEASR